MAGVYSDGQVTAYIQQFRDRFTAIETVGADLREARIAYEQPGLTVPAEVVELARSGDRIGAVKRYRAITGSSLDVANDIVSKL